ncbi:hypothetical protein ACOJQI_14085 [Bacillus salacetis]
MLEMKRKPKVEKILPGHSSKAGARVGRSKKVEDERERTPEWALPMRM